MWRASGWLAQPGADHGEEPVAVEGLLEESQRIDGEIGKVDDTLKEAERLLRDLKSTGGV